MIVPLALLLIPLGFSLKLSKPLVIAGCLIGVLLAYQAGIQILNFVVEPEPVLRLIRALLSVLIGIFILGLPGINQRKLVSAVFTALILHALLIDVAALVERLNLALSIVSGNDRWKPLRSSGLLAGFDIAGFMVLAGTLLLTLRVFQFRFSVARWMCYIIFCLAAFFTSRVSLALFCVIIGVRAIFTIGALNIGWILKTSIFLLLAAIGGVVFYIYALPILDVTFSIGLLNISEADYDSIVARHAVQDEDQFLWSDMFFLPNSFSEIIWGIGQDALMSDVGYVKDIFRYGLVGLFLSTIIYFYLASKILAYSAPKTSSGLRAFIFTIYLLTFLLSFKNGYFFTRSAFPLIILIFCFARMQYLDLSKQRY